MRKAGLPNRINLLLGLGLFISPWLIPYNLAPTTTVLTNWNFWIVGLVIVILAGMATQDLYPWEERVNIVLGLWLMLSPWVLGYAVESSLMLNSLLLGLAIAVLAAMALTKTRKLQHKQRT